MIPQDFGQPITGLTAFPLGSAQVDANPLVRKVTLAVNGGPGGSGFVLPNSSAAMQELKLVNLTSSPLNLYPALGDQFYGQSINAPLQIQVGFVVEVTNLDPVMQITDRTWYMTAPTAVSEETLAAIFESLPTTEPTSGLWNNGGVICVA